jgi:hypothetical protein
LPNSTDPGGSNNEPDTASPPWRKWVIEKPKAYFEKRRARKEQEKPEERYARKTALATIWMAVFTVVIAGIGVLQWKVLSLSETTEEETQRANIWPKGTEITSSGNRNKDGVLVWNIIPYWENTGNTPPRHLTLYNTWEIYPDGAPVSSPDFSRLPTNNYALLGRFC